MPTKTEPFMPHPDPRANAVTVTTEQAALAIGASMHRLRHYIAAGQLKLAAKDTVGLGDITALTIGLTIAATADRHQASPATRLDQARIDSLVARAQVDSTRSRRESLALGEASGMLLLRDGVQSAVEFAALKLGGALRSLPRQLARHVPVEQRPKFIQAAARTIEAVQSAAADDLAKAALPQVGDFAATATDAATAGNTQPRPATARKKKVAKKKTKRAKKKTAKKKAGGRRR